MQVFNVEGMSCGHCVRAITQAVQAKDPAASVRVDLAAREVGVESSLTEQQVIEAISEEGYGVKLEMQTNSGINNGHSCAVCLSLIHI